MSYDAFAVIGTRLVVFQYTVGKSHPVIKKAVQDLCEFVRKVCRIDELAFVFAMPSAFAEAFTVQKFKGVDKRILKVQPEWPQFVLSLEL